MSDTIFFDKNHIYSIFPFYTLTTSFESLDFPWSLWLKVQLWSSGRRWRLQKKRPHLHSMPNNFSLRLQVEQRSLFTSFFSSPGGFYSLTRSALSGILFFFSYFLGVIRFCSLNKNFGTFCSIVSTSSRKLLSRRSACNWRKEGQWLPRSGVSSLQYSCYSIITNAFSISVLYWYEKTQSFNILSRDF